MESPKKASTDRLEAFSDGIFAVAQTLLILDVRIPDSTTVALASQLSKLLPHIYAFVLSFLIVMFYWTAHHVVFNVIVRSDRRLLWVNALHLLFVVFLPFSTGVLAEFPDAPLAVDIYGTNIILCSLSLIALWLYAARERLLSDELSAADVRTVGWRLAVNPIVCAAALCVAFISTMAAILLYLVTPVWYILTGPDVAAGDAGTWRLPAPFRRRTRARSPK
ncbi:MAG TPA: TMEM175 family protein [Steroidobacteraceae bacterium]|nr:TMEM175 family protein [Steroidobacteraceae bacterium]